MKRQNLDPSCSNVYTALFARMKKEGREMTSLSPESVRTLWLVGILEIDRGYWKMMFRLDKLL